ncbi:hypothetical protein [Paenibacillus sp. HW567]|uniref:hypothetical protein n=1 Tax=Paenibacillus sp. HW567 TaxID=1034769 RepID=UPI00036D161C|nr:hypothetical protein [Paenibacillus sp. HW567]
MKLVKRALAVCLIVVLASGLSILTTAFVVNTYIQSALASFDIKLNGPEPGIGGFVKSLIGMDKGSTSKKDSKSGEQPAEEKVPDNALPVMGQTSSTGEQGGSAADQQLVMTPEAMRDMKDKLPTDDKTNIFNILMTKLPPDEMQKISKIMEDGLTESEVQELQQVIAKYVDPDEYKTLMKMLTPSATDSPKN